MAKIASWFIVLLGLAVATAGALALLKQELGLDQEQSLGLLSFSLGLLVVNLAISNMRRTDTKDALRDCLAELLGPIVPAIGTCSAVRESEFFALFPQQVKSATTAVEITNLSHRPPLRMRGTEAKDYFAGLEKMMKSTRARVRRIERLTPDKMEWVGQLIEIHAKCPNASLALIGEELGAAELTLAMSVQRVDEAHGWIVAPAEHSARQAPVRDIYISDKRAVELLGRYHDRLWRASTVVVSDGKVDRAACERLGLKLP